jgi:hypothetical protein
MIVETKDLTNETLFLSYLSLYLLLVIYDRCSVIRL